MLVLVSSLLISATPVEVWKAEALAASRTSNYCEAYHYYMLVADKSGSEDAAYSAFNVAYQGELKTAALEAYRRITDAARLARLAPYKDDLDTQMGSGKTCEAHTPVCGDALVDGADQCDDGGRLDGDGCTATCMVEPAQPLVLIPLTPTLIPIPSVVAPTTTTATRATASDDRERSGFPRLFIGGGVAGGLAFVTSGIALAAGVYENEQMNATTAPDVFALDAEERKGAEGVRNVAYVVCALAGGVGVVGVVVAVIGWE